MMSAPLKVPVHVEVLVRASCLIDFDEIKRLTEDYLSACPVFEPGCIVLTHSSPCLEGHISSYVEKIKIVDLCLNRVSFWQAELMIHPYKTSDQEPDRDYLEGEDELPASTQWELPNALLEGLWDSIIVDDAIKQSLIGYCDTSIQFADAGVDQTIISWNRMVLLHGPPGTGKTTLCKALAQKLFIRNSDRYSTAILQEVNSHSLFSKWFSESGKLVTKLFDQIAEAAEDPDCLVCVLIDEVESITASRSSAAQSNEPGDAVRVVNAVLTSLDALRRRPNVLILCTSNMLDSIDSAFLDRLDLRVYLGPPSLQARYEILRSCMTELSVCGIVQPAEEMPPYSEDMLQCSRSSDEKKQANCGEESECNSTSSMSMEPPLTSPSGRKHVDKVTNPNAELLADVAQLAEGCSGRSLRKLPMRAHALYLQRPTVMLRDYVLAMRATLVKDSKILETN
jgi:SpoVK/Ycf46/Vps4 family AAA+-type ATPase